MTQQEIYDNLMMVNFCQEDLRPEIQALMQKDSNIEYQVDYITDIDLLNGDHDNELMNISNNIYKLLS